MSEIRCPIYGFIEPSENELKVINTTLFQRLRRIKQLAMAFLVYPGANHTRFDHSIGVLHVASLMANKLLPEDNDRKSVIRLAALLHDIGHGPFSHISEDVLQKFAKLKVETEKEKIHETITENLIRENKELEKILAQETKEEIIGLLSGKRVDVTLMKEIVSGPIDADKMDYLLRDSYFCGVKYGVFDLHRLLNTLGKFDDNNDEHIAIKYDGINSLEQFVLAKYYITTQVYRHKIRAVSDAMIMRGLELGITIDEISSLKKLYEYNNSDEYLHNYLEWWDERIFSELIFSNKKGLAYEIFKRLSERKLFKTVFSEKLKDPDFIEEKLRDKIININVKENETLKKELETQFSGLLGCRKEFVILDCFTIKSVKEMSRDSEGEIIILDKDGGKKIFQQISAVFGSIDESMKDIYIQVYAPCEFKDLRDKNTKLSTYKHEILNILKNKEI
jgi:hypothetical protein